MKLTLLAIFLSIMALVVSSYAMISGKSEKTGYVYNQKIFSGFSGAKILQEKMLRLRNGNKKVVDSLVSLVEGGRKDLVNIRDEKARSFQIQERDLTEQYNAEIWKFINEQMAVYGKEYGYVFIYGASGDGGLMFADKEKDLTEHVIRFINEKYAK